MTVSSTHTANSSVLVTGATGFLGAYIVKNLVEKGYKVRAMKRASSVMPFFISPTILQQVEWVDGDVLDLGALEDAVQQIDAVVHAAAVVSFHSSNEEQMMAVNVQGTANVVNICLEHGVSRLVHVSSVAALGRSQQGDTVSEDKKWTDSNVNTPYAISKYKAEMEVWRAMAEGLNAVIANPSTIIGFGNWNTSSCALFKQINDGFDWYTRGINGFVYVQDAAAAVVHLMAHPVAMERFIINGENLSFQTLLASIATGLKKPPPKKMATPFLGGLAWRWEKLKAVLTGSRPLLTKQSAKVAQSVTYFDNTKLLKLLPEFQYTPIRQAIEQSCVQYLQHYS